jgi:hypothetical protein
MDIIEPEVVVAFSVQIMPSALDELKGIKVFDRRKIADAIDEQLLHQATVPTRNRKVLPVSDASFAFEPPLWDCGWAISASFMTWTKTAKRFTSALF